MKSTRKRQQVSRWLWIGWVVVITLFYTALTPKTLSPAWAAIPGKSILNGIHGVADAQTVELNLSSDLGVDPAFRITQTASGAYQLVITLENTQLSDQLTLDTAQVNQQLSQALSSSLNQNIHTTLQSTWNTGHTLPQVQWTLTSPVRLIPRVLSNSPTQIQVAFPVAGSNPKAVKIPSIPVTHVTPETASKAHPTDITAGVSSRSAYRAEPSSPTAQVAQRSPANPVKSSRAEYARAQQKALETTVTPSHPPDAQVPYSWAQSQQASSLTPATTTPPAGHVPQSASPKASATQQQIKHIRQALDAGELVQAQHYLQQAKREQPDSAPLYFLEGLLAEANNNLPAAADAYEACLTADPDHGFALERLGMATLKLGDYETAQQTFSHLLAIKPGDGDALKGLGYLAKKSGDTAQASHYYQETLKPDVLIGLASTLLQQNRPRQAASVMMMTQTLFGNDLKIRQYLNQLYSKYGQLPEIQKALLER